MMGDEKKGGDIEDGLAHRSLPIASYQESSWIA